ncbi:MAG: hypothetical protein AN490_21640 [Anabaena sp. AL09]|nr:MAG: hypothetical protein AN490_21640 [Anabaena sp. AL09]
MTRLGFGRSKLGTGRNQTSGSHGETEPQKATYSGAGHNIKNLTSLELIPAASSVNSGKSLGNPVVELATPNGTINQPRERIKTD